MRSVRRWLLLPGLALAALSLVVAFVPAHAATIHACYHKNSGNLRLVSGPNDCRNPELPISWSTGGATNTTAVSSAVSQTHDPFALVGNTTTTIMDLASENDDGFDHQITTTIASRIMATASAIFRNPFGPPREVDCSLLISDGTGPNTGLTPMGVSARSRASLTDPGAFNTMPLVGAAVKAPGTYNVAVRCSTNGGAQFYSGNLNVWTVGDPAAE